MGFLITFRCSSLAFSLNSKPRQQTSDRCEIYDTGKTEQVETRQSIASYIAPERSISHANENYQLSCRRLQIEPQKTLKAWCKETANFPFRDGPGLSLYYF